MGRTEWRRRQAGGTEFLDDIDPCLRFSPAFLNSPAFSNCRCSLASIFNFRRVVPYEPVFHVAERQQAAAELQILERAEEDDRARDGGGHIEREHFLNVQKTLGLAPPDAVGYVPGLGYKRTMTYVPTFAGVPVPVDEYVPRRRNEALLFGLPLGMVVGIVLFAFLGNKVGLSS